MSMAKTNLVEIWSKKIWSKNLVKKFGWKKSG
jgi:hypothetical protein